MYKFLALLTILISNCGELNPQEAAIETESLFACNSSQIRVRIFVKGQREFDGCYNSLATARIDYKKQLDNCNKAHQNHCSGMSLIDVVNPPKTNRFLLLTPR